jgi:SHS2 domain-containing protein
MSSHTLLPHTGELQLRIEAATTSELFVEAAHALAEIMGVPAREPPGSWRHVDLEARDREALLVAWLDELIARTELDDQLYTEATITEFSDHHLRARIRGTPIAATRTVVKAATFHRLRIEEARGAVIARVTLDV